MSSARFEHLAAIAIHKMQQIRELSPDTIRRFDITLSRLGRIPLNASADKWAEALGKLVKAGLAPSTVNRYGTTALQLARYAFDYASDEIEAKPACDGIASALRRLRAAGVAGPSAARHRPMTHAETEALLEAARCQSFPLAEILELYLETALRRSELLRVTWADLDTNRKTLTVRRRKHPRRPTDQAVPLSPRAIELLELRRRRFPSPPGARIFPYDCATISRHFNIARAEAGLPEIHLKDCRSTCAKRLFDRKFSVDRVATVTGHRDWKILQNHYARPDPSDVANDL